MIDVDGHLQCFEPVHPSYWLSNITLAKDCPSSNVLLFLANNGARLEVIKKIQPGEPLLMWFAECTRTLLSIPFLTKINMEGASTASELARRTKLTGSALRDLNDAHWTCVSHCP